MLLLQQNLQSGVKPVVPPGTVVLLGGGGNVNRAKLDKDSYLYRLLSPLPDLSEPDQEQAAQVIEQTAHIAATQPQAPQRQDVQKTMRSYGVAYRKAYGEIYVQLVAEMRQQQDDDNAAIAQLIALLM